MCNGPGVRRMRRMYLVYTHVLHACTMHIQHIGCTRVPGVCSVTQHRKDKEVAIEMSTKQGTQACNNTEARMQTNDVGEDVHFCLPDACNNGASVRAHMRHTCLHAAPSSFRLCSYLLCCYCAGRHACAMCDTSKQLFYDCPHSSKFYAWMWSVRLCPIHSTSGSASVLHYRSSPASPITNYTNHPFFFHFQETAFHSKC